MSNCFNVYNVKSTTISLLFSLFQRLNEFQRRELQVSLRELEGQGASAEAERRAMADKMAALLADREGGPKTMNKQ